MGIEQIYDHNTIEKKWQRIWEDGGYFVTDVDNNKKKYYVLDMFPYPSGAGLHVGHVSGYTVTDIIARYHRQKGFNVLHPMGWDSFGLPAEQYAIRSGVHPSITTEKNTSNFKRQMKKLGFSYDWNREISTSSPSYYKWTQWIFTKLYSKQLAQQSEIMVNYCPKLNSVLANEEVEGGFSKEGGFEVFRKPLKQWVLKIPQYADRLLYDLNSIDWPECVKKLQRNWIGRSEGVEINFSEESSGVVIKTFTTRADTILGVSYIVLAPENEIVKNITSTEKLPAIKKYIKEVSSKSDIQRTSLEQEKSGEWTGAYAIHPITKEKIPIWISDYVLADYGTGAVMGVPAHDSRDFSFAKKYNLPIKVAVEPSKDILRECYQGNCDKIFDDIVSGKICWEGSGKCIGDEWFEWVGKNNEDAKGIVGDVCKRNGFGSKVIRYKLRDWVFSRQRFWGEPFPIIHFEDGSQRVLSIDELPLQPPDITDYKPRDFGESPLSAVDEWVNVFDNKSGKNGRRETDTMPQWAGSCWYYLRFCDPHNDKNPWDKTKEKYWMPVDIYVGGMEHAVLHLLYARFWHKVLYDCGEVSSPEPFKKYVNIGIVVARSFQKIDGNYVAPEDVISKDGKYLHAKTGEILKSQIEKMSKSKLNGVSPDDILEEFGADTLRLYEMFMGPIDKEKLWDSDAIQGCHRFLNRYYKMSVSTKLSNNSSNEEKKLIAKLIDGVSKDLESLQFNTAIAKMMEFLNNFQKLKSYSKQSIEKLSQLLFPFAPHVTSEIWERLGNKSRLDNAPLPVAEKEFLVDDIVEFVIQVNGKVRGKISMARGSNSETVFNAAKNTDNVKKYLSGDIKNIIHIPDRLLNIVVK